MMKITINYDKETQLRLAELRQKIEERQNQYLQEAMKARTPMELEEIKLQMLEDNYIKSLSGMMIKILNDTCYKTQIVAEDADEVKMVEERFGIRYEV